MTESQLDGRQFSQAQLGRLHGITQQIEKICRGQLRTYLDALAPLFRPRRLFGNHMEGPGKETVPNADQNLNDLREVYFKACGRPFDLRKELPIPLESVPTQIQLHEWEYSHDVQTERERATINITAPLTWVLAYPSPHSYSMVRQLVGPLVELRIRKAGLSKGHRGRLGSGCRSSGLLCSGSSPSGLSRRCKPGRSGSSAGADDGGLLLPEGIHAGWEHVDDR